MLAEDIRPLDIVLATTELLDLINLDRGYFDSIELDDTVPVNWHPEELFIRRLDSNGALTADDYTKYRHSGYRHQVLYSSSTLSSTSNNYINQVFMKAVLDKTGVLLDEKCIVETLRKNKKGYAVLHCY